MPWLLTAPHCTQELAVLGGKALGIKIEIGFLRAGRRFNSEPLCGYREAPFDAVKDIFLSAASGTVVAKKRGLAAVAPTHDGGEVSRLRRTDGLSEAGDALRKASHHEDDDIERVNAVRRQPSPRAEGGWA